MMPSVIYLDDTQAHAWLQSYLVAEGLLLASETRNQGERVYRCSKDAYWSCSRHVRDGERYVVVEYGSEAFNPRPMAVAILFLLKDDALGAIVSVMMSGRPVSLGEFIVPLESLGRGGIIVDDWSDISAELVSDE